LLEADETGATADFPSVINNVSLLPSRLFAGGTRLVGIMCEPGSPSGPGSHRNEKFKDYEKGYNARLFI